MNKDNKIRVLFICLGNICRSPLAETVFKKKVEEAGLTENFEIDSAGLIGYHAGETADPRMLRAAREAGYNITHLSRKITDHDYRTFDYIIGMDSSNMRELEERKPEDSKAEIRKLLSFCGNDLKKEDIPDPYYGGEAGFARCIYLVQEGCDALLEKLKRTLE